MSQRGTVKFFNAQKGYGFILGEKGEEYFVHFTAIAGEGFRVLTDGEPVAFDKEFCEQKQKWQARNVTAPDGSLVQPAPVPFGGAAAWGKGGKGFGAYGFGKGGFKGAFAGGFDPALAGSWKGGEEGGKGRKGKGGKGKGGKGKGSGADFGAYTGFGDEALAAVYGAFPEYSSGYFDGLGSWYPPPFPPYFDAPYYAGGFPAPYPGAPYS